MINYNMALTESIKAAVTELHNNLLINEGYANLAQLSQRGGHSAIAEAMDQIAERFTSDFASGSLDEKKAA